MNIGFACFTGKSQSSFTLVIPYNAPVRGGNVRAIDDSNVATCLLNMSYSPSLTPALCDSNSLIIYDAIRSCLYNYIFYEWARSTNGGSSWTDVTAVLGSATPCRNGSAYQFVSSYTVLPVQTSMAASGDLYRLIVATTFPNPSSTD